MPSALRYDATRYRTVQEGLAICDLLLTPVFASGLIDRKYVPLVLCGISVAVVLALLFAVLRHRRRLECRGGCRNGTTEAL